MKVRFFSGIKKLIGCAEADIPYQESVGALVNFLKERYGEAVFGPEIIILINGRHAAHLGGFNAIIREDDKIDIFQAVSGG